MSWQDIVLSVGSWIFLVALFPAILSKDKPPLSTSLPTGIVLVAYTGVYFSLHLYGSMASTGLVALAWLTLAMQKYIANRKVTFPAAQ